MCIEGSGHQVVLAMNQTARGGIWVETVSFGVSHLACNRCPANKHTEHGLGRGPPPHPSHPPWRWGRPGAPPNGGGGSERDLRCPGSSPGLGDTAASLTLRQCQESGLGISIHPPPPRTPSPCPGPPARRLRLPGRGAERLHRPGPESCGPPHAAAVSLPPGLSRPFPGPRPVPYPRGVWPGSRGHPGMWRGGEHLTPHAVIRFLSPRAGGCSWVCYRWMEPSAVP